MSDPTAPGPLAATAALMADPARARMLAAMMGGEAMTAGELARIAGIVPATASGHLSRLVEGGLVEVHAQGRHRYHRLASEEVAAMLETLGGLSARLAPRPWKHGDAARDARLCWNHIAGRLGVALHERLTGTGWLTPVPGGWAASAEGRARLAATGVDLDRAAKARRFACDCMDWSERRAHLAGGLGTEIATAWFDRGWLRRLPGQGDRDVLARRRVTLTPGGRRALREDLGIELA